MKVVFKAILNLLIGLMFTATGILKLIHMDNISAALFERANYPALLFYVVGVLELAGGVMLLIEKTRKYGSMIVLVIMIGAIFTHVYLNDHISHIIVPAFVILFAGSQLISLKRS